MLLLYQAVLLSPELSTAEDLLVTEGKHWFTKKSSVILAPILWCNEGDFSWLWKLRGLVNSSGLGSYVQQKTEEPTGAVIYFFSISTKVVTSVDLLIQT